MVASKVISMSKNVELDGISVATLGDEKMIDILNLAVLEIHKRFQISTKVSTCIKISSAIILKFKYNQSGSDFTWRN